MSMFPIFIIGLFTGVLVSIIYYKYKADTPSEVKLKMQEAEAKVRELQSQSVTDKSLEQLRLEIQRELVQKWNRTIPSNYVRG